MSTPKLLQVQAIDKVNKEYTEKLYQNAGEFFSPPTHPRGISSALSAPSKPEIANENGAVQFQLIGQKPTDAKYDSIMQENASNLLAIGGLVYDYINRTYPNINPDKLSINTWLNVIEKLPDIDVGKPMNMTYNNSISGLSVSGEFFSLIADATINDVFLLFDFVQYLTKVGNSMFKANSKNQYNMITCTYQNYLISTGLGVYRDYGAIVLREIKFNEFFQELQSSCITSNSININISYAKSVSIVQTQNIRQGGRDYTEFQALINENATKQFAEAENFFNAPEIPQKNLTPRV